MGFGSGKVHTCRGKPANPKIFSVKFLPTFSGLRTAEKLNKYFADREHGKLEFRRNCCFKKSSEGEGESKEEEESLYGYLAVAEDLDKLDPETKRRSLLKSKKDDIEAIADAPLKTD